MDETSFLLAQLHALSVELSSARRVLDGVRNIEPGLHERLGLRFGQLLSQQQSEVERLQTQLEVSLQPLDDSWKQFQELDRHCRDVLGETLALLGGLLVRHAGLDHGVCLIADKLCDHLAKASDTAHGFLTLPAANDSFTGLTNIVRLHFPDFSIWRLPVVAHEFGHYLVARKKGVDFPYLFSDILEAEGGGVGPTRDREAVLEEQFADLFAVYSLGPAYACACIMLEFDPRRAYAAPVLHPSDAERVYFILQALNKLQVRDVTRPYRRLVIDRLQGTWQTSIDAACGRSPGPDQVQQMQARVDKRLDRMYAVLDDPGVHLAGVKYEIPSWTRTRGLSASLLRLAQTPESCDEPAARDVLREASASAGGQAITLPDVLNGAWRCRLENERVPAEALSEVALRVCLVLASG